MNLKNLSLTGLFSLIILSVSAQLPVKVDGILARKRTATVKLFKVSEGKTVEIATSIPQTQGHFGFLFYPEYEGIYVIGTGQAGGPQENYKFYFKGGEQLSLSLTDSTYVLRGSNNSRENIVMTQWHDFANALEQKSINFMSSRSTFVDFFPQLEEIAQKSKTFLIGKSTGNTIFDQLMKENIRWDLTAYAVNFVNTPRSVHPSVEQFSPFYATLKATDLSKNTGGVYSQPWGARLLEGLVMINMRQQGMKFASGLEGLKNTLSFIPNDTLKGDFVLKNAAGLKTFDGYRDLDAAYGHYLITKEQQQKGRDIQASLASLKAGSPAYTFSYPDPNGNTVTMASLKGKVVLVDVWATWCGPCKAEIPHLKKLEEEMKGTDVQVVSISVDEAKDKEKWLKMIKDMNLGGLQLFASGWGDLAKYYKITGIPRFMVFDRQGKIVTVDSPRPSSPELKKLLEQTLAVK